jgi:hypothetical protein
MGAGADAKHYATTNDDEPARLVRQHFWLDNVAAYQSDDGRTGRWRSCGVLDPGNGSIGRYIMVKLVFAYTS